MSRWIGPLKKSGKGIITIRNRPFDVWKYKDTDDYVRLYLPAKESVPHPELVLVEILDEDAGGGIHITEMCQAPDIPCDCPPEKLVTTRYVNEENGKTTCVDCNHPEKHKCGSGDEKKCRDSMDDCIRARIFELVDYER